MFFKKEVPTQDLDYDINDHGPVYRFFSSFGTYFLKFVLVNAMFLILNIPSMLVAFGYCLVLLPNLNPIFVPENFISYMNELGIIGNQTMNDVGSEAGYQLYYLIIVFCVMFLIGSTLICIGPFQAGFSTIYRNIARGHGTFLLSDFKDGIKDNWKQSLISSLISWIFTLIALFAVGFYANHFGRFGTAVSVLFFVAFLIFTIIHNMVNYLIVTVELPLKNIYKNGGIFFLIKFVPCIGLMLLLSVLLIVFPCVLLLTTTYFAYAIAVVYYLTIGFVLWQYVMAFFTNELVNKYIAPATEDDDDDENDENTNIEYTDKENQ